MEKIETSTETSSLPSPDSTSGTPPRTAGSQPPPPPRSSFRTRASGTAFTAAVGVVTLGLFAVLVVFVQATRAAESASRQGLALSGLLRTDVSTTLAVLRASQGLLSALTAVALSDAFVFLQWAMIGSPGGLQYLSLLALSPTTWNFGTLALLCSSAARVTPKFWALLRISLTIAVWLSGLVLFFNTSLTTVYDTAETFNVTAGVGPFNGSLVQPFMNFLQSTAPGYPYAILPFTYFAAVYILVVNPLISTISEPVHCVGTGCVSYLLSGGLEMVAPWQNSEHAGYPMVKIENAPSMQFDFSGPVDSAFSESDCDVFGQQGFAIGIKMCVARDAGTEGSLRAGLFVCTNGTDGDACVRPEPRANITTSVSLYTRAATVVASRSNYTIVSIAETTPPQLLTELDLPQYRAALRWLLNYTAANVPAPSSISQSFWSGTEQLKDASTYGILAQNFQSILVFPFWLFNSNNWGNIELQADKITTTLPRQFYTTASVVAPHVKIRFDPGMFAAFVVLQGSAMLFVWGVLCWVWFGSRTIPKTSAYPIFDVAFKAKVDNEATEAALVQANSWTVIEMMRDAKAYGKGD